MAKRETAKERREREEREEERRRLVAAHHRAMAKILKQAHKDRLKREKEERGQV